MRDFVIRSLVLLAATALIATYPNSAMTTETTTNPLLAKWEGPFGGVPPFDKVQVALFKPALEAAMTEQLAEIDKHREQHRGARFRKHHRRPRTRR